MLTHHGVYSLRSKGMAVYGFFQAVSVSFVSNQLRESNATVSLTRTIYRTEPMGEPCSPRRDHLEVLLRVLGGAACIHRIRMAAGQGNKGHDHRGSLAYIRRAKCRRRDVVRCPRRIPQVGI